MTFALYGLRIACDFPLPELAGNHVEGAASVQVRRAPGPFEWEESEVPERVAEGPDGQVFAELFVWAGGHRVRFPGLADFEIADEGVEVTYLADADLPRDSLAHLLLDHVLPLVAQCWGALCLHATAVERGGVVHAFVGPTGSGKSTLAAALAARGARLWADDCLALWLREGRLRASPGYAGTRLFADAHAQLWPRVEGDRVAHYTGKRRVVPPGGGPVSQAASALGNIFLLERAQGLAAPTVEALAPADAAVALAGNCFRLDLRDRDALRRELGIVKRVLEAARVRRLRAMEDLQALPELCRAFEAELG